MHGRMRGPRMRGPGCGQPPGSWSPLAGLGPAFSHLQQASFVSFRHPTARISASHRSKQRFRAGRVRQMTSVTTNGRGGNIPLEILGLVRGNWMLGDVAPWMHFIRCRKHLLLRALAWPGRIGIWAFAIWGIPASGRPSSTVPMAGATVTFRLIDGAGKKTAQFLNAGTRRNEASVAKQRYIANSSAIEWNNFGS